jgi:hypothetical protein
MAQKGLFCQWWWWWWYIYFLSFFFFFNLLLYVFALLYLPPLTFTLWFCPLILFFLPCSFFFSLRNFDSVLVYIFLPVYHSSSTLLPFIPVILPLFISFLPLVVYISNARISIWNIKSRILLSRNSSSRAFVNASIHDAVYIGHTSHRLRYCDDEKWFARHNVKSLIWGKKPLELLW